jgi:hypothetical protein
VQFHFVGLLHFVDLPFYRQRVSPIKIMMYTARDNQVVNIVSYSEDDFVLQSGCMEVTPNIHSHGILI